MNRQDDGIDGDAGGFVTLRTLLVIVPGILLFIGLYLLIRHLFPELAFGWVAIIWYGVSVLVGAIVIVVIYVLFKAEGEDPKENGKDSRRMDE